MAGAVPDHWTELLSPEQLEAHYQVLDLANRHIAHRVDEREHMNVAAALLTPPPMPRAVAGIAVLAVTLSGPQPDLVTRLEQWCIILLKILKDQSEKLGDAFMEHVNSQDLDSLYDGTSGDTDSS